MSDYAQARWKDTKEPTIIRIMSHEGGMNPDFGLVDVIPDEDLNKRLQFYVSRIVRKSRTVLNAKILKHTIYVPLQHCPNIYFSASLSWRNKNLTLWKFSRRKSHTKMR